MCLAARLCLDPTRQLMLSASLPSHIIGGLLLRGREVREGRSGKGWREEG